MTDSEEESSACQKEPIQSSITKLKQAYFTKLTELCTDKQFWDDKTFGIGAIPSTVKAIANILNNDEIEDKIGQASELAGEAAGMNQFTQFFRNRHSVTQQFYKLIRDINIDNIGSAVEILDNFQKEHSPKPKNVADFIAFRNNFGGR
jgi:hypothetical protein